MKLDKTSKFITLLKINYMKIVLPFVVLVLVTLSCLGQHPELLSNEWYLTHLEEPNGNIVFPPYGNSDLRDPISVDFRTSSLQDSYCLNSGNGNVDYGATQDTFVLSQMLYLAAGCVNQESRVFELEYYLNRLYLNGSFHYEIRDLDATKKRLIITNPNALKGVYTNTLFSAENSMPTGSWQLASLVVNSQDVALPRTISQIPLTLTYEDSNGFDTEVCNVLVGHGDYNSVEGQISLSVLNQTFSMCPDDEANIFESAYFNFYFSNAEGKKLDYEIIDNSTSSTLIITTPNGDQATYDANALLSNDDFEPFKFSIFPNPVTDILNISTNSIIGNIIIYDIKGQIMLQTNENVIDTDVLRSGIYFIQITSGNSTGIQKIIKL